MSLRRRVATVILVCSLSIAFSSCVVRRRLIVRKGSSAAQPPLLVADESALLEEISRQYRAVRDFSATVDMVPALGSAEKSKITEYKDVRAYILFRHPADIRIIGLYPVVRNKAFDMTSDGTRFRLYIPTHDAFIEGANEMTKPSESKLENLRPQHFVDALLVRPVDQADRVVLENLTDESGAFYILLALREENGALRLRRAIWFNRVNLEMARQLIFDAAGNILTDARYSEWHAYDRVPFPKHVEINRPQDDYGVVIDVVKMEINKGVTDDKFVLQQPPGTKLRIVGQPPAAPAGQTPASSDKGKSIPE